MCGWCVHVSIYICTCVCDMCEPVCLYVSVYKHVGMLYVYMCCVLYMFMHVYVCVIWIYMHIYVYLCDMDVHVFRICMYMNI